MNDVIVLPNLPALSMQGSDTLYYGGDQEWFANRWQRQAGCGPTNCANLLWYLAKTRRGCAPLCPYDASHKEGFIQLMEDVWQYVTPGNMGVNSTDIFADGAKRYGEAKGLALLTEALVIDRINRGARDYHAISLFVAWALSRDLPVAFLNLSNGTLNNLDSWHWVTIVSLRGDDAMIYDQGKPLWVNLKEWTATSIMGGGFVTIEAACAAEG